MQKDSYVFHLSPPLDLNMLPLLSMVLFPLLDTSFLSFGGLSPLLDSALAGEAFVMAEGL